MENNEQSNLEQMLKGDIEVTIELQEGATKKHLANCIYLTIAPYLKAKAEMLPNGELVERIKALAKQNGELKQLALFEYKIHLDAKLLNEAAKAPYQSIMAMTDLGNMLLGAFRKSGMDVIFDVDDSEPIQFDSFIFRNKPLNEVEAALPPTAGIDVVSKDGA